MQRTRLTEEHMIRIVPDAEVMGNVRDVCRQHKMAEQTLDRWRRQCGGMDVAEAKRRRALERAKAAVKRLVGDLMLDNRMLQDVRGTTGSAARPGGVWPPPWSRRTARVTGAPGGCGACPAAPHAGSQAMRKEGIGRMGP